MSKNRIDKIRNSRPFEKHDLVVYAVLILFVAVLFLSFVILPKKQNYGSFSVSKNGTNILTYSFDLDSLYIQSQFEHLIEKSEQNGQIYIKIFNDQNKTKFNTLLIDKNNKTVDVVEANCSSSKECVHMPKIAGSGAIYCAPHALSITCGFISPTVG